MKIDHIVREMYPPRYTTAQAADLIGKSPDTLRRWRRNGTVKPSDKQEFGSIMVPLYTPDDIIKLREAAKATKPGPKPQHA